VLVNLLLPVLFERDAVREYLAAALNRKARRRVADGEALPIDAAECNAPLLWLSSSKRGDVVRDCTAVEDLALIEDVAQTIADDLPVLDLEFSLQRADKKWQVNCGADAIMDSFLRERRRGVAGKHARNADVIET
jgi:hypothetical protein